MDIEKELKEIEDNIINREEWDEFCIVYDTRSDGMSYSMSEFIKSNRFIRNRITSGTVKVEKLTNDLMVVYTDKYKSVKDSLG